MYVLDQIPLTLSCVCRSVVIASTIIIYFCHSQELALALFLQNVCNTWYRRKQNCVASRNFLKNISNQLRQGFLNLQTAEIIAEILFLKTGTISSCSLPATSVSVICCNIDNKVVLYCIPLATQMQIDYLL